MEKAIYSILSNASAVTTLASTRIYPNYIPQNAALPAVVYHQIAGRRDYTMDGASAMLETTYQVTCYAASYSACRDLADAVRGALSAYSGTAASVTIDIAFLESENDVPVYEKESDVIKRYGKDLDFTIWFRE